jgi:transposase-like protein
MVRQKGSPKRKRLSEEQVQEIMRMRRQGESIKAIAQAIGCHRQTVRLHLQERREDILVSEIRKQLLTDELQRHLNDVTEFAVSFRGYLTRPNSLREDRDDATVFKFLLGNDLPQGLDSDSQQARRGQRQIERQGKMLLMSLREHTRDQGWWRAYEEWREAWNTCQDAFRELRREADEVVGNLINQKPSLKEEVERQLSKERDVMKRILDGVLWGVWRTGTTGKPVQYQIDDGRIITVCGDLTYDFAYRLSEVSPGPDMAEVCKLSYETLCQSFSDKGIPEMLHRVDEKIEVIDDALDPFILRPLLVRTRCKLCPV